MTTPFEYPNSPRVRGLSGQSAARQSAARTRGGRRSPVAHLRLTRPGAVVSDGDQVIFIVLADCLDVAADPLREDGVEARLQPGGKRVDPTARAACERETSRLEMPNSSQSEPGYSAKLLSSPQAQPRTRPWRSRAASRGVK